MKVKQPEMLQSLIAQKKLYRYDRKNQSQLKQTIWLITLPFTVSFLLIGLTNLGAHLKTVSSPSGFFSLVSPPSQISALIIISSGIISGSSHDQNHKTWARRWSAAIILFLKCCMHLFSLRMTHTQLNNTTGWLTKWLSVFLETRGPDSWVETFQRPFGE